MTAAARKIVAPPARDRFRANVTVRLMRRFAPHLREHRAALSLALLCTVGAAAMEILGPWPIKVIFDGILIPQKNPDAFIAWLNGLTGGGTYLLAATAVAILLIAIVGGIFSFGQSYLIATVGQKVVASIRRLLYGHIQRLSQSFHDTTSTGDLLARLTSDVRMMRDLLVSSVVFFFARILVLVGTLVVMALLDWRLTTIALVVLPVLALITGRFAAEIKTAVRSQRKNESRIAHLMTESLSAIKVVQAYSREAFEEERFQRQNASSLKAGVRTTRLEAHLDRIVQVVIAFGTCAVIWYGVLRVQAGAITPGDLLVFTAYLATLYKPIRKLAGLTGRVSKATVCAERVLTILELEPEIKDAPDARPATGIRGTITLDDVGFGYVPGQRVLDGATLEINAGETVAFISESGSGKTTIAHLILRFYDPEQGRITIDGTDVRDFTLGSLRDNIAILLQESVLFNASIRDNIAYGKLDATDDEITAAARLANAHDFIERMPDGYDTVVGQRGATLSGGQRQRIAIARAFVRNAPIVILDEPLTGLDAANEATVQSAIKRLIENRTCLIITHDWANAALADHVYTIRDGRIVDHQRPAATVTDIATRQLLDASAAPPPGPLRTSA